MMEYYESWKKTKLTHIQGDNVMPRMFIFKSPLGVIFSVLSVSFLTMGVWTTDGFPETGAMPKGNSKAASAETMKKKGYTLLPTHRIVTGVVEEVTKDHAKVDHDKPGKMRERYLELKRAKEKGFTLKPGDRVEIVVNEKNHVVDYHLEDGASKSDHRVIKGKLAQPMNVGQEHAILTTEDGKEESFPVLPHARSEVAAIPLDTEGLFLIDETNKITSAALMKDVKSEDERKLGWIRTPAKGVYHHVNGIVQQSKPDEQTLTIQTNHNETVTLPVWDYLKEDMAKLSEDQHVTVLVDHKDRIVNIAFPPEEGK